VGAAAEGAGVVSGDDDTPRVTCQSCDGSGSGVAFVDYGPPREHESGLHEIPCPTCEGAGSFTLAEHTRRLSLRAEGARLRAFRVRMGESLRTASARMRVSVTEWSAWERGKRPMSDACRAWMEANA
jgi:hypothetical protein